MLVLANTKYDAQRLSPGPSNNIGLTTLDKATSYVWLRIPYSQALTAYVSEPSISTVNCKGSLAGIFTVRQF